MDRAAASRCLWAVCLALTAAAPALDGTLSTNDGTPVPFAFVALMTPAFSTVTHGATGLDGAFTLDASPKDGFLIVQPGPKTDANKLQVHPYQPRIYAIGEKTTGLKLVLPAAVSLVIEAYDADGKLMRWADFQRLGVHGGQFMYATNLEDEAIPAVVWPVHGALTGKNSGSREEGLPAVLVEPGTAAAVNVLFWPVPGYGKLLLRADNAGQGYAGNAPGDSHLLLLNLELARTAVSDLEQRASRYPEGAKKEIEDLNQELDGAAGADDSTARAAQADSVLAKALALRDQLELERARAAIPGVRQGTLEVNLTGDDVDLGACEIAVTQKNHDFLFGAFEGSPYNGDAFATAREGGFEYATVLLGWNWTGNPKLKKSQIDHTFGMSRLKELGYRVKAHGVVWMQGYGILPDRVQGMPHDELTQAAIEHLQALLEVFGKDIDIWEAINEPANTNVVGLPREAMLDLLTGAGKNIVAQDRPALVNSPHEFSYGAKFLIHNTDNQPKDDYPLTFSNFLARLDADGRLVDVGIIGLQFYPGFHLNQDFGEQQGPAYTPSYLLDTLDRYARFGKTLHITELSFPSSYGKDWFSGYWREPWTEETQADYAEAAFTLAFAHPSVQSIGWWDILDSKPAVITGGLLHADGRPKPIFERLSGLFGQWTTKETIAADANGQARFQAFGGDHTLTVTLPSGETIEQEVHVLERCTTRVTVDVGE